MLVLNDDGTITGLDLKWLQTSEFDIIAPTRDHSENIDGMDGEIDFGTEFSTGRIGLRCVSKHLTKEEIYQLKTTLAKQLNDLREYTLLSYEGKGIYVRLTERPEITDYPNWFEVHIPLTYQPYWVSLGENSFTGDGTLTNEGTIETPLIIEIQGPVTDPEITIGDQTLSYLGILTSNDKVTIDTDKMTVKFNSVDALDSYNKVFPKLQPGDTQVSSTATVTYKWRDRWE